MQLLHHVDVVQPRKARLAPADVLEAAGHVLLPVEVVGRVALVAQAALRAFQHFPHLVRCRKPQAVEIEIRALFEREGVHRHVRRPQRQNLL